MERCADLKAIYFVKESMKKVYFLRNFILIRVVDMINITECALIYVTEVLRKSPIVYFSVATEISLKLLYSTRLIKNEKHCSRQYMNVNNS